MNFAPASTFDSETKVFDIIATLPQEHELKRKISENIKAFMVAKRGKDSNIPKPCTVLLSRIVDSRSSNPDFWKPGAFYDRPGARDMIDVALKTVTESVSPAARVVPPAKHGELIDRLNQAVAGAPADPPHGKAAHAATPLPARPASPPQSASQLIERLNMAMGKPSPAKPVATTTGPIVLTRAAFDKLSHPDRSAHFRNGGKLID